MSTGETIRPMGYGRRQKAVRTGPHGKFDSTGSVSEQQANLATVTRMLPALEAEVAKGRVVMPDRVFIEDCRVKLRQSGSRAVFGWKQVERVVTLHRMLLPEHCSDGKGHQYSKTVPGVCVICGEGVIR